MLVKLCLLSNTMHTNLHCLISLHIEYTQSFLKTMASSIVFYSLEADSGLGKWVLLVLSVGF